MQKRATQRLETAPLNDLGDTGEMGRRQGAVADNTLAKAGI